MSKCLGELKTRERGIVHRDLNPDKVLFKVVMFSWQTLQTVRSFLKPISGNAPPFSSTFPYMAPEMRSAIVERATTRGYGFSLWRLSTRHEVQIACFIEFITAILHCDHKRLTDVDEQGRTCYWVILFLRATRSEFE